VVPSQADPRGTKAVVFGGCGFLGSHLAQALVGAGADTLVYDAAPRHVGVPQEAAFRQDDVLDAGAVRCALEGADRVYAFTGGSGAPASLGDPLGDLAAGCQAQLVLLEAIRSVCPEATVVFPGSRLEYGCPQSLPVAESHPLGGNTPYAIHKSACAGYYRVYAELHGLRTIVLRLSNPYGPHPMQERYRGFGILNHFLDQALLDRPIRLFGDGSQLRDFVFIDDVVDDRSLGSPGSRWYGHQCWFGRGRVVGVDRRGDNSSGRPRIDRTCAVATGDLVD
jgi:UDP-glucose 4-epimerase